jgi:hypothetical protein
MAILWLARHIDEQDVNEMFYSGTGVHVPLGINDTKQPDVHFSLSKRFISANLAAMFPTDPKHGPVLPQLCMEIAVENDIIPTLVDDDSARYFVAGSGTRCWIGIQLFLDKTGQGVHRWYCVQKDRDWDPTTNSFLNTVTINPASFPCVHDNHRLLSTPIPGQTFCIDVQNLIRPIPLPATQPATFTVDLEALRLRILRWLE